MDEQGLVADIRAMLNFHSVRMDDIQSIEHNCGTVWITMKDETNFALALVETDEP